MNSVRPPRLDVPLDTVLNSADDLHEALVDVFGQYVMWLRHVTLAASKELVSSPEAMKSLSSLRRERFEGVARMTDEQQEAACAFTEATLDRFIQLLTILLTDGGNDLRIGAAYAARFNLDLEIVNVETEQRVCIETINHGGKKSFFSYWGRWLNRFGSLWRST